MTKNVLVLGADGFCGWPTVLHLAACGYNVAGLDNMSRRRIDEKQGWNSLTPIADPFTRTERARQYWKFIGFKNVDLDDIGVFDDIAGTIDRYEIDAVVHFAEQRSAPYSMRDANIAQFTVENNITVTHNVLQGIKISKRRPHLVHLGTMGVYGYGRLGVPTTPEGYIEARFSNTDDITEILHPMYPGSVYHMTKCMDQIMFQFYAQNDGLRITDLHQGIVWGTQTSETMVHPELINRFDYDGDFGTVLNRFLVQAALDVPFTIYGSGKQTRAFIHISDTVECVRMAIDSPPNTGDRVKIVNQVAETASVYDVAERVADAIERPMSIINHMENPRKEAAENSLAVDNTTFRSLGWQPIVMNGETLQKEYQVAHNFRHNANKSIIMPEVKW